MFFPVGPITTATLSTGIRLADSFIAGREIPLPVQLAWAQLRVELVKWRDDLKQQELERRQLRWKVPTL